MPDRDTTADDNLRLLVDTHAEYAMFVLDPKGHIQTWNHGAERIKGYTQDEIVGQHFSIFYTDEDKQREYPQYELEVATRTGHYEDEGWRVRKDGGRFWASVIISALRDADGRLVGFGKVTRDLTSRRLNEEQLRSSARDLADANAELEQFRLLVASVRDYAIFVLDAGGHVRTWNAGAEAIKGYTADEIIGRHFSAFYTQEDRARNHPGYELEVASREGRFEEEGWRVRKDGRTFWANVVITALRNEHGILVGYAKVTRDLTERYRAEQELRTSAAELARVNAELERFASAAAHDLIEPLQTMAGFADLIERRYGDRLDDLGREFLGHISGGAERMRRLIDGLLRYSRTSQRELALEPVDIAETLERALSNLQATIESTEAIVSFDPGSLPCVSADRDLLVNVMQNLVANAIKFRGDDPPQVTVTSEAAGRHMCRIVVTDNGIGVAPEHQGTIFGMFGRVATVDGQPGVGLGLALCERVITRLGGEIGVESTPGSGSRFWFTLPAMTADRVPAPS